jgi:hypothetical protein
MNPFGELVNLNGQRNVGEKAAERVHQLTDSRISFACMRKPEARDGAAARQFVTA